MANYSDFLVILLIAFKEIQEINNGCSPAHFERDPERNKMQHTEETKKSKEGLVEELMAKLKENLMKGRNQVAAKEDIVEDVVKQGGLLVKKGVMAEMEDEHSSGDIFERHEEQI